MKSIITIEQLEGNPDDRATLYLFRIDEEEPEYFKFCEKFETDLSEEIEWAYDVIGARLDAICRDGAEDEHFRMERGPVKALPINVGSLLRLYCYRIDRGILILGNGGIKPRNPDPTKNRTQDFPELHRYCETVRMVGTYIEKKLDDLEFGRNNNELDLDPFEINIPE